MQTAALATCGRGMPRPYKQMWGPRNLPSDIRDKRFQRPYS